MTKRSRTAADGKKHDATLAMDPEETRHPMKEPTPDKSEGLLNYVDNGDISRAKQQPEKLQRT